MSGAIKAAAAWVCHGAATVNALASTVDERLKTARAQKDADAVLKPWISWRPGHARAPTGPAQGSPSTAEQMAAAIGFLTGQAPSAIAIKAETYTSGNGAKARRPLIGLAQ